VWDLYSHFPPFWDAGDDSDASEPSDESTDYITFTGRSASIPPELEPTVRRFDLSEPSPIDLDFPEDVGDSLEHDALLADGDQGVINHLGRPTLISASGIPVELLVQPPEDSPTPPISPSDVLFSRRPKLQEDSGGLEPLPHLPYLWLDIADVPINVPPSPFVSDLGGEVEEQLADANWLGESWGEMTWSGRAGGELMEWDRWCGEVIDELNRDLGSWAEVRQSVRAGLDRF